MADNNEEPLLEVEYATVTRVLVYTGPKAWIELTLRKSNIPMNGKRQFPAGAYIESGMVQWEPLPPVAEPEQPAKPAVGVYVPPPRGRN